jgi:hypothetical protein
MSATIINKEWLLKKLDEKLWHCGGEYLDEGHTIYGCLSCPHRAQCEKEYSELAGNIETQSFYFHVVRLCEIIYGYKKCQKVQ